MMPWRSFLARLGVAALVGGVTLSLGVFVGMRLATADPGGPTRPELTYAGVLRDVDGRLPTTARTTTLTFMFAKSGVPLCTVSVPGVVIAVGGAFTANIPIASCGSGYFDGTDITYEVAQGGEILTPDGGVRITPVPYARFADQAGVNNECPAGYQRDTSNAPVNVKLCRKYIQDGLADYVVRVGSGASAFWIDRFEASIWARAPGTMTGLAYHDSHATGGLPPAFRPNGQWRSAAVTEPFVFAYSAVSVTPASHITWFQANEACAASGKRLATGDEWLRAAQGTPDSDMAISGASASERRCNTAPPDIHQAHRLDDDPSRTDACVSVWGATDMIGNLWEWTAEWSATIRSNLELNTGRTDAGIAVEATPEPQGMWPGPLYQSDGTWNVTSSVFGSEGGRTADRQENLPAIAARGGSYVDRVQAGVFALNLYNAPTRAIPNYGFRCVIPR